MVVQLTTNTNASLLAMQQAAQSAATRKPESLQQAAAPSRVDSLDLRANPLAAKVGQTHQTLHAAQRGVEVLRVANENLDTAAKHLEWIHSVVAAGKSDPSARLALADGLAQLDQTLHGARYQGETVLDGTDFSIAPGAHGAGVTVAVGSPDLRDLASLLATGGRGFAAINLDDKDTSIKSVERADLLLSHAKIQIAAQTFALGGLFNSLTGNLDELGGPAMTPDQAGTAAGNAMSAIAAAPQAATAAHSISTAAAENLLMN
ncbi:hypothetical protein [uncultured Mobiluncus sp.]|uniref:hypothetical protein n=1 Tax=uncultured Mobiluncus sp. TaxID=293425 RepID=UPI0025E4D594|nr:hypothetical protein [uncultured Mobiluncus sp.]